jgi:hypothetical protein
LGEAHIKAEIKPEIKPELEGYWGQKWHGSVDSGERCFRELASATSTLPTPTPTPTPPPVAASTSIKAEMKPAIKPEGGGGRGGDDGRGRAAGGESGGSPDFPIDRSQILPLDRPISEDLQQIMQDIQSDDIRVLSRLGFRTVLKPHQKEAVVFALHRASCDMGTLILDSMGLGKTVETLALMCCIRAWKQTSLPFLVCVPKGLVDQWTEEIFAHTMFGQFGDGVTSYVAMDRHSLNPDYSSIATHSVIITTRHIILSDMKLCYKKAQQQFSSALLPGLTEFDAARVLIGGHGKVRNDIAIRYPELANAGHPSYQSFHESVWAQSSAHVPKYFAALVVDEAHQLRNASAPTTRAVYAILLSLIKLVTLCAGMHCPRAPAFATCSLAHPTTTAYQTLQRCRGCCTTRLLGKIHSGGDVWTDMTGRQGGRDLSAKAYRLT